MGTGVSLIHIQPHNEAGVSFPTIHWRCEDLIIDTERLHHCQLCVAWCAIIILSLCQSMRLKDSVVVLISIHRSWAAAPPHQGLRLRLVLHRLVLPRFLSPFVDVTLMKVLLRILMRSIVPRWTTQAVGPLAALAVLAPWAAVGPGSWNHKHPHPVLSIL